MHDVRGIIERFPANVIAAERILAGVITGARSILLSTEQPCLPTLTGIRMKYLKGVTDERVVILDVPKRVADADITVKRGRVAP